MRFAADPQRGALAALLAAHGEGDYDPITIGSDPGLQFRAVDAITGLAEELALRQCLVIGLDDLQWADPCSLLTPGALGRRLADLPVTLIGCLRARSEAAAAGNHVATSIALTGLAQVADHRADLRRAPQNLDEAVRLGRPPGLGEIEDRLTGENLGRAKQILAATLLRGGVWRDKDPLTGP